MKTTDMIRNPINGTFELTARCNLRCKMCLIRIDNNEIRFQEKSAKEWIHMAEQVRDAGTLSLLLTGGEPMLRPDFIDIYSEIASMGFLLNLYTNATMITPEIYKALEKYPPHTVGVTVYGASNETYGKVAGSYDAYDRMIEGVEKLRLLPSRLTIRTTIIKDNLEDLDRIRTWVNSIDPELNFNISRIVTMPVRGGTADIASCRLTPEQNANMLKRIYMGNMFNPLEELLEKYPDIRNNNEFTDILTGRKEEQGNKETKSTDIRPSIYGCHAGIDSYTLTWDGKLIGCQMLSDCCTYPFEDGFIKAWDDFPSKVKLPPIPEKCMNCTTPCTACYAIRMTETGRMDGWPEYICKEAKLNEEMNKELMGKLLLSIGKN